MNVSGWQGLGKMAACLASRAGDAGEGRQAGGVAGVAARRGGDVAVPAPSQDADGEVAQAMDFPTVSVYRGKSLEGTERGRVQVPASHFALKLSRSFCIPGLMTRDQMSG